LVLASGKQCRTHGDDRNFQIGVPGRLAFLAAVPSVITRYVAHRIQVSVMKGNDDGRHFWVVRDGSMMALNGLA
jgi:hypothetical protein